VIPYLLAALGGYLIGEATKSKLLDNAANDSIADAGLEVASASVLAKGGMIAPNGKPSNLTPEQYKLVRTPEFKAWFGDWENDSKNSSKVVDENGEPLVVYHGTSALFNKFQEDEKGRRGGLNEKFWSFTTNKEQALIYALDTRVYGRFAEPRIISAFLNIRDMPSYDNKGKFYRELEVWGGYKYIDIFQLQDWHSRGFNMGVEFKEVDGFEVKNTIEMEIRDLDKDKLIGNTYYVKNSNQIKLADGSNTTFDTSNPDIRYSGGGKINLYYRAETSNDFKKEKIFEPNGYYERVGKDGNPVIKYDEYVISDTPEIAASKTIYGAILGAASMMKFSQGIKKDNKIQIYLIDEKPDVDISHWQGADFEYLDEVRYRNSIVGKHLLTYELTDDVYRLVKDFYEYKEWENNLKYDDQLEFDNRLEYIYQMIEDEKLYSTLKKLIDKSL
jgi:hypothetical protein